MKPTCEELEAGLREAETALKANMSAWITLEPLLNREPYPDDPRWTPWTRFGERAGQKASRAAQIARDLLARTPDGEVTE